MAKFLTYMLFGIAKNQLSFVLSQISWVDKSADGLWTSTVYASLVFT